MNNPEASSLFFFFSFHLIPILNWSRRHVSFYTITQIKVVHIIHFQ